MSQAFDVIGGQNKSYRVVSSMTRWETRKSVARCVKFLATSHVDDSNSNVADVAENLARDLRASVTIGTDVKCGTRYFEFPSASS